jgi:hypothetical protein
MVAIVGEAEQGAGERGLRFGGVVGRAFEREATAFDARQQSGQVGRAEVQGVFEGSWAFREVEVGAGELESGEGDGLQASVATAFGGDQASVAEGEAARSARPGQMQRAAAVELSNELYDRQQADAGE